MRRTVAALVPALAAASISAQDVDILATAAPTSIYLETVPGNGGETHCDWYLSAEDFLAATADAADDWQGCRTDIRIRGIINREGALRFSRVVSRIREIGMLPEAIVLDSRGGDADAAISMARIIRREEIFTRAPVTTRLSLAYDTVCFSACVVVFSAGYERELEFDINGDQRLPSRVGIHGPGQFDRASGRYDSSSGNSEIERVKRRLKDYFGDIDVDTAFVDDMFAVPFDEIRLLTRDELVRYGLYR